MSEIFIDEENPVELSGAIVKTRKLTFFETGDGTSFNCVLEFSDATLKEKYRVFRIASTSPRYALITACFLTFGFIFYWLLVLADYATLIPLLLFAFSAIFAIILMWTIVFLRYHIPMNVQKYQSRGILAWLESLTMIGLVITTGLVITMRSQRTCVGLSFQEIWSCVPGSYFRGILGDISLVLVSFPFILSVAFPFVPYSIVLFSLALGIVFLISLLIYVHALIPSTFIIVSILLNIFIVIFTRLQNMEMFLCLVRYYTLMEQQTQRERQLTSHLNDEMRNLIANVSHDLKSVSVLSSSSDVLFFLIFSLFLRLFMDLKVLKKLYQSQLTILSK
jgi:signal transduction histidine kinase